MPTPPGCRYLWIEDRDISTYMVLADSSYFGELDPCEDSPAPLSKIARGKLSLQQTEQILLWYDKGMAGTLEDSANSGRQISSEAFSKSLKILVMHHYLFEPPEYTEDYFLKIRDRDLVFRNLALAGFDLLLCGHKHIAAPIKTSYHRHFDKRAMRRLALNHLRRCAGLPSAPLLRDQGGVWRHFAARVSKPIRWFADKLARARRSAAPLLAEGPPLENVLEAGLRDPTILRQYLNVVLAHQNRDSERVVEGRELMEICKSLDIRFSPQERKAIASVIAGYMNTLGNRLIRRPFVQLMSGSTTKASLDQHKDRHFNIYRISLSGDGFEFNVTEYDFNDEAMEFSPTIPTPYLFPYNRGLPLLSNTLEASADQISGSG